jgi:hypothetical protein
VDTRLRAELENRLRAHAERTITDATGLAFALNVPLKQQVRTQLERLASNWLARAVLHVSPQGLVIQLAGVPIVRWVGARLEAALRHSGNPGGRAQRTITQFAAWRKQMLLLSPTSSLPVARSLAAKIEHELSRTGFLQLDLRRAGRLDALAQLERAESLTRTSLALFRARFLLDSPMARADLDGLVDRAKRVKHDVEEITRKLAATPTEEAIVGDWEVGGVMRVTRTGATTFVGRLVKTYTFCHSGSVPLGQVEWKLTRTAANTYTGTVRYYKVSDCTYIGDATGATWDYRPADDTLKSCSYSPNPALPGGGCSISKRVKS